MNTLPLRILSGRAREDDIRKFTALWERLNNQEDRKFACAILYACAEANRELFLKIGEDKTMQSVLREIMRDEFTLVRNEGLRQGRNEGLRQGRNEGLRQGRNEGAADMQNLMAERMIRAGKPADEISLFTGLDKKALDFLAQKINTALVLDSFKEPDSAGRRV